MPDNISIIKQVAEERSTQSNIVVKAVEDYLKRNEK